MSSLSEKKIKIIGLTGVMGAGKSSVIEILKELSIPVIDCDSINKQLQQVHHEGFQKIVELFGHEVLHTDGTIHNNKLSQIIFHNKQQKEKLETIMHPLIKKEICTWVSSLDKEFAVVEVPLLFEIMWESYFDEVWVVSCNHDILLDRLAVYRNISKQEACLRLEHQLPQDKKEKKADYIIWNNTNKADLKEQIITLLIKEGDQL